MHSTMASFATDHVQPYFYPPTIPEHHHYHRNSRRSSTATYSGNKSSRSIGDRRRSSGALSTYSQSQKPRKCIGEYVVGKTLGKGASGRVKLGVHRHTGEQVAIKIISKAHLAANPAIEKAVRREIAIMKLIHHPNVMSLIDVIDDPTSSDLYLILEYVEGGELFEYLVSKGRLNEAEARHHFQQIILGLDYCHHHLICHRDLKPENLLLNSRNNIKIADFGMASLQPLGSMLETSCGSPHYASPEIVAGLPYNGSSCDIWSCGVILYALLTGHLPFDDENIRQLLKKVKSGKYIMPDNISAQAQDLLRRILVVDPSKRLNMEQIMAHPWFRETEPVNVSILPVPPTESEIGQPVSDASEIDDRILETIKFLWGETSNDVVIEALTQKEYNMQKVIYVLLQQHAERYWQADHADDSDDDFEENSPDASRRRYRTISHRKETDNRRCLSMVESSHTAKRGNGPRPSVPSWAPPSNDGRRYSSATIKAERHAPPPPSPTVDMCKSPVTRGEQDEKKPSKTMKKSETFYARFVKKALSSSRRQHKEKESEGTEKQQQDTATTTTATNGETHPPITTTATGTVKLGLVGTLRRKNPFTRTPINTTDFAISPSSMKEQQQQPTSPVVPPKSTLRPTSHILQRNKVDPSSDEDQPPLPPPPSSNKSNKSATLSAKRLSLRIPNAFRGDSTVSSKKFGFTLGSNSRRQRKQLDLTLFQDGDNDQKKKQQQINNRSNQSIPLPPPAPLLSDGSTLSSSSSLSSRHSNNSGFQNEYSNKNTLLKKGHSNTMRNPSFFSASGTARRSSQASFKSSIKTSSNHSGFTLNHRPTTPSLLSNSSTMNSPISPASSSASQNVPKASWLSNLFFFKQPKVCSLVVYSTHTAGILRSLHRLMNKTAEARFYEKTDRTGCARYKAEIKTKTADGKMRQVKCRIDLIMSDLDPQSCVVQFTQQQGDGVLLNTTVHQLHQAILKEYPCPSNIILSNNSFKELNSVNTSATLVEEDI